MIRAGRAWAAEYRRGSYPVLPELGWGKAVKALEELGEIIGIGNAAELGDILDLQPGGFQQLQGIFHPHFIDLIDEGMARFLMKIPSAAVCIAM